MKDVDEQRAQTHTRTKRTTQIFQGEYYRTGKGGGLRTAVKDRHRLPTAECDDRETSKSEQTQTNYWETQSPTNSTGFLSVAVFAAVKTYPCALHGE